jgi:hypothetical protein
MQYEASGYTRNRSDSFEIWIPHDEIVTQASHASLGDGSSECARERTVNAYREKRAGGKLIGE